MPGVLFFLGVSNPEKGIVGMPHSPGYAADDEAIFVGARAMAAVLLDFLESQPAELGAAGAGPDACVAPCCIVAG